MPYGYPNSFGYPAPYPDYPAPYASGAGVWIAVIIVLFILLFIFAAWWWYSCFY
ncbi:hypothetical protein [Neobacillus sp.]|uniref:hypothetical protein n=1 Tax=Neobacillus sp. TaxID=2675273 RepID=UPI002898A5E3|nr:hypothetical protein [Neobacillus sp.]